MLGDAELEEIDCALLRLAEPIGDLPPGGGAGDPKAEPRGVDQCQRGATTVGGRKSDLPAPASKKRALAAFHWDGEAVQR